MDQAPPKTAAEFSSASDAISIWIKRLKELQRNYLLFLMLSRQFTQPVIGTSAYMAPETFRVEVSVKLDSFAFGVVLVELLTGPTG